MPRLKTSCEQLALASIGLYMVGLFALVGAIWYAIGFLQKEQQDEHVITKLEEKPADHGEQQIHRMNGHGVLLSLVSAQNPHKMNFASEALVDGEVSHEENVRLDIDSEASDSVIDFFRINSQGTNIAFILDVSRSMLAPQCGDIDGFTRLKYVLIEGINALSEEQLFNVYAFSDGLDVFSAKPVAATASQKGLAAQWIDSYWRYEGATLTGSRGVRLRNYVPDFAGYPIRRHELEIHVDNGNVQVLKQALAKVDGRDRGAGSSRLDMALFAAFEQLADTLFLITDGIPNVSSEYTSDGLIHFQKVLNEWYQHNEIYAEADEAYQQALREFQKKISHFQRDRFVKGSPMETNEDRPFHGFEKMGLSGWVKSPGYDPCLGLSQIASMVNLKAQDEYQNKAKRQLPALHIVGYSTDELSDAFFEAMQRNFSSSRFKRMSSENMKQYGLGPEVFSIVYGKNSNRQN